MIFKLLANAIWSVLPVLINESETYCIFYLGESSRIMLPLLLSWQSAIQERILYSLMCRLKFDCKKAYDLGHSQLEFQFLEPRHATSAGVSRVFHSFSSHWNSFLDN